MKNSAAVVGTILFLLLIACERPGSPDFHLENKLETPIAMEKVYTFLGGNNALIDTTRESLDSLFSVNENGVVSFSRSEELGITTPSNIFPTIDIEPTDVSAEIGTLRLGTFSAGNESVAELSFESVVGQDPPSVSAGMPIPDQTNRKITDIRYSHNYFKSAEIKSGTLVMTVENRLGFDIDEYIVEVYSGSTSLGTVRFPGGSGLAYEEIKTGELPLSGKRLEDLNFTITVSWFNETLQTSDPGPISINKIGGKNIEATSLEAYIPLQRFSVEGMISMDDPVHTNIRFTESGHYVELKSGMLRIHNIHNEMDVDLDTLVVSFPDIRRPPYAPGDSLVVRFQGSSQIRANSNNVISKEIALDKVRVYAENQSLNYNIYAVTEDVRREDGASMRTIHAHDKISAKLELQSLEIQEFHGVLMPQRKLINSDIASNGIGTIDLFNSEEAEVVNIEAYQNYLRQLNGISFASPVLSIFYETNIGFETTIYAAIAGVNADGEVKFLSGKQGGIHHVNPAEAPRAFRINGQPVAADKLIKFKVADSGDGTIINRIINFESANTNIDEFISHLPQEIRFVGMAAINEDPANPVGTLVNPVHLQSGIRIGLPLNLSAKATTLSDTVDVSLNSLPKQGDDHFLKNATFSIDYVNRMPFRLQLNLVMLDEELKPITRIPLTDLEGTTTFSGAPINSNTQFAEGGSEGEVNISLTEEQLTVLRNTRHMVLQLTLNTTNQQQVRVRADDSISLSLQMSVTIESHID